MNWPVFFGEEKKTKPWHYKVNRFIMVILLLNALVVFLSTFPYIKDKIGVILHVVDVVTSLFFVVEVSLRIWVADLFSSRFKGVLGRVRYCLTPTGLIDFLATYPPIICMPFGVSGALLKALRVVRLVRLFRFMRAFRLLGKALNNKKQEMLLSLGFLAVVTFMLSLVLYYIEQEEVNTHYTDGLDSVKWAFLQYIGDPGGFGGDGPATIGGRIIASVIGVIGIAVFAVLPAL